MRTDDPPKLVVGCGAELSTKSKIEGLLRKECHLDTVLAGKVTVAVVRADNPWGTLPTGAEILLHPSIPGWVLVPIAPHTLSNRPIVLANATEIAIEVVAGRDASASFDTQSLASLLHGDRIIVTRSKFHARFLHPKGWSYFDTLRQKLHWNEGVA